ncbi:hypothetical protein S1OALGB6SA_887 [Olavius algarvensis spirochete endosymbiont]|nr:hypothetical protein S1OALGB6SA_887 [Olavius algarvensis spirochete endosymbiont]
MNLNRLFHARRFSCVLFFLFSSLLLFSCNTSKKSNTVISDSVDEIYRDMRTESAAHIREANASAEASMPLDYLLTEIDALWKTDKRKEAKQLFGKIDKERISPGWERSQWAYMRGLLFTEKWSGSELGLAGGNVSALLTDNDDVWIGTWTGGITRLSDPLQTYTPWDAGLPTLAIRTVNRIRKHKASIWVVRYGVLERYDIESGIWELIKDLPVNERLQDLCILDNKVYLGTLGEGLWVKEGYEWSIIPNPGKFITRLELGDDEELIVTTMNMGLFLYRPRENIWIRPPSASLKEANITSVSKFGDRIVGGTFGDGAFIWNTKTSEVLWFGLEELGDLWVLSVAELNGLLFFGTFGSGLNCWNLNNGTWDRLSIDEGLPSVDVTSLSVDTRGNIWAGTLGGGLVKISGDIYDTR